MKIAYWVPNKYVTSVKIYTENVIGELEAKGFEFIPFRSGDKLPPDVDLYWDSTCTGGKHPNKRFRKAAHPVVVTVHGAAPMALPLSYTFNGKRKQVRGWLQNQKKRMGWQTLGPKVDRIITVSEYAKKEILENLPLAQKEIHVIYHGFDSAKFNPADDSDWEGTKEPYYFHISVYQPKKNIERIIEAYRGIPEDLKQPLLIISPGYPGSFREGELQVIGDFINQGELSAHMRRAQGFIFPSLHESFGLPILEAMASGCPVLTSNSTSCVEIAGDAALLVDPEETESIRQGMIRLFGDAVLRKSLRKKGLERAGRFSWKLCAENHARIFALACKNSKVLS